MARRVNRRRQRASPEQQQANVPEEEEVDIISTLPNCLLMMIISLLPAKDGVRTTILSSRFRNLWASAPLNLEDSEFCTTRNKRCKTFSCSAKRIWLVTRILDIHNGPVRRFCLSHESFDRSQPFVDDWLNTVSRRNIKELELHFFSPHELPSCIRDCNSIEKLTLHNNTLKNRTVVSRAFAGIAELTMSRIRIKEEDLEIMFSTCQSLRSLSIECPYIESDSIIRMHVRSRSLRSLMVVDASIHEIFIVDAPNLERFLLEPGISVTSSINIGEAPNLRKFGYITMPVHMFVFGDILMRGFHVISGTVHNLRALAITVRFNAPFEAAASLQLLGCFPRLETLHIQASLRVMDSAFSHYQQELEEDVPIECLARHLRKVRFNGYVGRRGQLEFVQLLLQKGKVLEEIIFTGPRNKKEWSSIMERELVYNVDRVSLVYQRLNFQDCFEPVYF